MYVYNESVSHDAYKAFDGLVRTSELRDVAGTITLSMDAGTLEIVAAFTHPSSTSTKAIARRGTWAPSAADGLTIPTIPGGGPYCPPSLYTRVPLRPRLRPATC